MTPGLLLALALPAAAAPSKPAPAGEEVEFRAVDGWALKGVWRKAEAGRATIVLLHGTGQRKEDWRSFARAAARGGYGYVALDLRGHGDSRVSPSGEALTWKKLRATAKGANDFADMTRDVEAVVAYLAGQGVPEETIGLAGAEVGGSVAVKYAAVHTRVPFVVMLSPGLAWQEIPLVNAVRAFKGRATPILMVHSEADKRSSKETPLLYEFAKRAVGERNVALLVLPQERGTRLFKAQPDLAEKVLAWIANPAAPVAVSTPPAVAPAGGPGP